MIYIKSKKFGSLQTNCYLLSNKDSTIIIDPGEKSHKWIEENSKNIKAIFLTHGHYDHTASLKKIILNNNSIPIYINILDKELLKEDFSEQEIDKYFTFFEKDIEIKINNFEHSFYLTHIPGHTSGSSGLYFKNNFFSGDLIFKNTVGRHNFWNSSVLEMKESLKKLYALFNDSEEVIYIYPGHDSMMTFSECKNTITTWIELLNKKILKRNNSKNTNATSRQKAVYLNYKNKKD